MCLWKKTTVNSPAEKKAGSESWSRICAPTTTKSTDAYRWTVIAICSVSATRTALCAGISETLCCRKIPSLPRCSITRLQRSALSAEKDFLPPERKRTAHKPVQWKHEENRQPHGYESTVKRSVMSNALTSEMPCSARIFRGFFMDTGHL